LRKFILRNEEQERLATVLYFYENVGGRWVGMIWGKALSGKQTWFYQDEKIEEVIADLALRLNINYHDFIEME
jgi:hypothetical protein